MKKMADLLMGNKFLLPAFAGIVFLLKYLIEKYPLPSAYDPLLDILTNSFLVVFFIAVIYVLSFIILVIVKRPEEGRWWEKEAFSSKSRDRFLDAYMQGWFIALAITIYGVIVYYAVFMPWRSIAVFVLVFFATWLIYTYRKSRRAGMDRS
jgi:hypothetical protein